jgi:hypothetical protein
MLYLESPLNEKRRNGLQKELKVFWWRLKRVLKGLELANRVVRGWLVRVLEVIMKLISFNI